MIAREGILLILIGLAVTLILVMLASRFDSRSLFAASLVFGLLTLFTTYFFRDPPRHVPEEPDLLVSPADGRVVAIDHVVDHPIIRGPATKISIFLSVFDVHVNRTPTSGVIDYVLYNPGQFLAAYEDKASDVNEQTEIGMTTPGGHKLVVKQIAGVIARRIVCRLRAGDSVASGERFGLIRFGSRTDLIIPADSRIDVKLGDRVRGGETIMGRLPVSGEQKSDIVPQERRDAGL